MKPRNLDFEKEKTLLDERQIELKESSMQINKKIWIYFDNFIQM